MTLKRLVPLFLAIVLVFAFVPGLSAQHAEKININKASIEELTQLQQIGPEYAERIVHYREAHGPFENVEDITKVKGIGPKTLQLNKDLITIE